MLKKEFKVGDRVFTKIDMCDSVFGWLAARKGTVVSIVLRDVFPIRVDLDFLKDPLWKEWGTNPIPFNISELEHLEDVPWLKENLKENQK